MTFHYMIPILFLSVSKCHEAVHLIDNMVKMHFTDEHHCFVTKHYYLSGHSYACVRNIFFDEYHENILKMQIKRIVYRFEQHNQISDFQETRQLQVCMLELVEVMRRFYMN